MATKTTGAEFKRFYHDPIFWPEDKEVWHEEEDVVMGSPAGAEAYEKHGALDAVDDNEMMTISGGIVFNALGVVGAESSFEDYFRKWRKLQNISTLIAEVPNDKLDEARATLKALGCKIL